ncbi:hypothetical protein NDU88_004396 [Pleurodeles waltl]|uniref:Uncharacterized protein n=1 Tax=Pleurodeles waltl TaxID=8319 RepID=A0AAV7SIN9_PLEWA|nr:hypothetical protein NDU88_004396 [Pleurodeles waltl]
MGGRGQNNPPHRSRRDTADFQIHRSEALRDCGRHGELPTTKQAPEEAQTDHTPRSSYSVAGFSILMPPGRPVQSLAAVFLFPPPVSRSALPSSSSTAAASPVPLL